MRATDPPPILWQPSPERRQRATITRFAAWLEATRGLQFESYDALWRWSVEDLEAFWAAVWEFFDVRAHRPYERVLAERRMPGAVWFEGAHLNYAEHLFRDRPRDATALCWYSETRGSGAWTWGQLEAHAGAIAAGFRELGIGRGDRVVAYMPNIPETVAAFAACASIGAVWSSCSPEFGAPAVIDRCGQIEPTLLLAVDGYRYGGRVFDRREVVATLARELPSLRHTVLLPQLGCGPVDGTVAWSRFAGTPAALNYEPLPFVHPLWILYSSGTTGLPKAIVQSQGGILVEHLKALGLHVDLHPDDRFFWFTTTAWMMWNFLVGGLLTGASIVLFDGRPDPDRVWDLVDDARVTTLGVGAAFLESNMKAGLEPRNGRDLTALHAVGSTGSPLSPDGFRWVYDHVGDEVWLFSTSGGTDVCTPFVGGAPTLPVHEGELQARALGVRAEAWDPHGRPLIGQVGELVVTEPMPSMPIQLWNDPGGERLEQAYFSTYPGVWRHGDWIEITERGTAVIYGRSDSTINRDGVRMGTSELYRAVLREPDVLDALAVDVPGSGGATELLLFVVLREGDELSGELVGRIERRVRVDCSPRHVPDAVLPIPAVPRTLSGKALEVPVKRLLMGEDADAVASRHSLADPAALDWFEAFAAQRVADQLERASGG